MISSNCKALQLIVAEQTNLLMVLQGIRTDKARNEAREAATALRRQATGPDEPVWLQRPGGVVIKVSKKVALATLQAGGHAVSCLQINFLLVQQFGQP
jgi:hypothetical protein